MLSLTHPLTPPDPAFDVNILIFPLEDFWLIPLIILTSPPERPKLFEVLPAAIWISPPVPELVSPTRRIILPALPLLASPVFILTRPAFPKYFEEFMRIYERMYESDARENESKSIYVEKRVRN